jgi:hypothetical protein
MTGAEKRARRWVLREMTRIEARQSLGTSPADRSQVCQTEAIDRDLRAIPASGSLLDRS